ncbi:MAG: NAD(P)-binding domain-containing protein, partial [Caulobacteraceae bacterium]
MKHFAAENPRLRDSGDLDESAQAFIAAAAARTLAVGILGLGYVGLPLAEALIATGFGVIGFDVNQRKIDSLRDGRSYIRHIGDARIQAMNETERLMVTTDIGLLAQADALLICVPTPINAHREPELSYVIKTSKLIAKVLRHGKLIVLE